MNKPVRVVLIGEAYKSYKRLNEIIGLQLKQGKENSEEMQLMKSIQQKEISLNKILFTEIIFQRI